MGRLIDADKLKIYLKEYLHYEHAIPWVDAQPTAYDVEKVVAELESKKEKYYKDFELATDTLDIICYGNMSNVYGHAIEIVKRGGAT